MNFTIPPTLFFLTALRSRNQLSALPAELSVLTKLEVLSLAGNKLTELPIALCALTSLRVRKALCVMCRVCLCLSVSLSVVCRVSCVV